MLLLSPVDVDDGVADGSVLSTVRELLAIVVLSIIELDDNVEIELVVDVDPTKEDGGFDPGEAGLEDAEGADEGVVAELAFPFAVTTGEFKLLLHPPN